MNWIEVINNLGIPVAGLVALAWFIYYVANRWMNESSKREETLRKDSKEREDRLIEANKEFSKALTQVAGTLADANEQNRILSENNKIFTEQLDDMNDGINKIINKLENIEQNT